MQVLRLLRKIDSAFFGIQLAFIFVYREKCLSMCISLAILVSSYGKNAQTIISLGKKNESHLLHKVNVVWFFFGLDKSSTQLEFKLQYFCIFVFIFLFQFASLDFLALLFHGMPRMLTSSHQGDPGSRISPFPENFQTLSSSKLTCPVFHCFREFLLPTRANIRNTFLLSSAWPWILRFRLHLKPLQKRPL